MNASLLVAEFDRIEREIQLAEEAVLSIVVDRRPTSRAEVERLAQKLSQLGVDSTRALNSAKESILALI